MAIDVDPSGGTDHVVLVDHRGRPSGAVPKAVAHHAATPLHLAFSCHVVRHDGAVLLTRRAASKVTWPATWTNACCGHPHLGETLRAAATRRLAEELGLTATRLVVAIGDFAYRATMDDGTAEHELCPVLVVEAEGTPDLDPAEVDDARWVPWDELVRRAADEPHTLSPWSVEQVAQLTALGRTPRQLLDDGRATALLDEPVVLDRPATRTTTAAGDPLAPIRHDLVAVLDAFVAGEAAQLHDVDPSLADVAGEIRALVEAGGKRLRPAFTYWGHRATGAAHDPGVLRPAAAIELLHTFALLHDDVMDRSATRRGRAAAHRAMADGHRRRGDGGDADWFGVSAAVLTGDLAFVWADELFESADVDPAALARARRVFTDLRREVIAGQYLDLRLAGATGAREGDARHVALLKSARYTVTRPLLLGAALGDPTPAVDAALRMYGDAVGLAFQLRDDVLGLFGSPEVTGKSRLDDLREGKRTVLVLRALRLADPAGRSLLERSLGDPDLDEVTAARCRDVVASSGALASVERLLAIEHERALHALDDVADADARAALEQLAALAIERSL